jgi:hypothetical protein
MGWADGTIGLMGSVKVDLDKVHEFKDAQSFYKWLPLDCSLKASQRVA